MFIAHLLYQLPVRPDAEERLHQQGPQLLLRRYNMLFRWLIGLSMDAPVWDVTVFTKNRARLLEGDVARSLLLAVLPTPASSRCCRGSIFRSTAR